jgi:hypothetical protein
MMHGESHIKFVISNMRLMEWTIFELLDVGDVLYIQSAYNTIRRYKWLMFSACVAVP